LVGSLATLGTESEQGSTVGDLDFRVGGNGGDRPLYHQNCAGGIGCPIGE